MRTQSATPPNPAPRSVASSAESGAAGRDRLLYALSAQQTDPGEQCPAEFGTMRCSRDRYHTGSHVCRPHETGKRGMAGWAQTPDEAVTALVMRVR